MTQNFSVVFCFFICFAFSQEKKDNIIQWQDSYRLKVSDFQKPMDSTVGSHSHAAYKIEIYPSEVIVDVHDYIKGYENLTVVAEFYKHESFFNPEYEKDLLKYEQLSFDIAELFARKIRKRFDELKKLEEKRFSVYNFEYNTLWKACMQYHKDFSKATNNGWEADKDLKLWQIKIKDELEALKAYAVKPL